MLIIVFSLIIGYLYVKIERKKILLILSTGIILISHLIFLFLKNSKKDENSSYNISLIIIGFIGLSMGFSGILTVGMGEISKLLP